MSRSFTAGALAALAIILFAGCTSQTQPKSTRAVVTEFDGTVIDGQALSVRVPDVADGNSGTNPPGSVEVFSTANLVADTGRTRCTSEDTLWAPVTVKNYATEQLTNVAVQFTDVTPFINKVCNAWPSGGTPPLPSELLPSMGLISYGDIAGSAVSTGSAAGGEASREWWFNWGTKGAFAFKAKIWATVTPAPPTNPSPASGSTLLTTAAPTLTWTGSTADARVEIATDPAFTNTVEAADLSLGAAPYNYSYTAAAPVAGTIYYWRAFNRFIQPAGSTLVRGTFSTGGSYQVGPTSLSPANGSFAPAGATTVLGATVPDAWSGAVFTVCSGAPPCTTALHTSGTIAKSGSTVTYTTPALSAGRYTWRVASNDPGTLPGYAESGFYMDAAPTNLHSEYVFAYKHRFYADTFAPWVDFYWYGDDPALVPYTSAGNPHLDAVRIVGPPTFTAVDDNGIYTLYWWACTQYGGTSNATGGNTATQGACTAVQTYTYP